MLIAFLLPGSMPQAAVALTTMVSVVGSYGSGALAGELHTAGLPSQILQDLAATSASVFSEVSGGARAQMVFRKGRVAAPGPQNRPLSWVLFGHGASMCITYIIRVIYVYDVVVI